MTWEIWALIGWALIGAITFASYYEIRRPNEGDSEAAVWICFFWPVMAVLTLGVGVFWCIGMAFRMPARGVMYLLKRRRVVKLPEARVVNETTC